jgi:hypothetical protein
MRLGHNEKVFSELCSLIISSCNQGDMEYPFVAQNALGAYYCTLCKETLALPSSYRLHISVSYASLAAYLKQCGILLGDCVINPDYLRRNLAGNLIRQSGGFQIDWQKIGTTLCAVDPHFADQRRKTSYHDMMKQLLRSARSSSAPAIEERPRKRLRLVGGMDEAIQDLPRGGDDDLIGLPDRVEELEYQIMLYRQEIVDLRRRVAALEPGATATPSLALPITLPQRAEIEPGFVLTPFPGDVFDTDMS